jgi:hypothetical protein
MENAGAVWFGVILSAVIQVVSVAFIAGKISETAKHHEDKIEDLEKWRGDRVDPVIGSHETRITVLERARRGR